MIFKIRANMYNLQVFEVNNFYFVKLNCLNCFYINSFIVNKNTIDKELENKQVYKIEKVCDLCRKKIEIEVRRKIEFEIKE